MLTHSTVSVRVRPPGDVHCCMVHAPCNTGVRLCHSHTTCMHGTLHTPSPHTSSSCSLSSCLVYNVSVASIYSLLVETVLYPYLVLVCKHAKRGPVCHVVVRSGRRPSGQRVRSKRFIHFNMASEAESDADRYASNGSRKPIYDGTIESFEAFSIKAKAFF